MQKVVLQRLFDTGKQTLGRLYIDGVGVCYTLEDTYRPKKIKHKTRISAGLYKLQFRKVGRFYNKYSVRFKSIGNDKGMIEITGVPNFLYILIHIGNYETDTSGCVLVGSEMYENDGNWYLKDSTVAYKKVYPLIRGLMEQGDTYIEVRDEKELNDLIEEDVNSIIDELEEED